MNPVLIEMLLDVQSRAAAAGHGGKCAVYDDACRRLAMSRATLLRRLKDIAVKPERKRRSDAGACKLSWKEAWVISAFMMEGFRANNKSLISVGKALEVLRGNGRVRAEWVDADGVVRRLSESAVARALRQYALHPQQLRRAPAAQPQGSDYPNDVWLIDASISTLFYVPEGGLEDMSPAVFYKNKPGNFERIKRQRLTRYVITDHCSGCIFVHYVAGGESIVNLTESFLAAIAQRSNQQMYGVPFHLVMDPGSGDTISFKTLLRRLQVVAVVNAVGNPRAKGQVEGAHNLVERDFESGFKFTHVPDIAWINAQAARWMRWFNGTKVHSRHGKNALRQVDGDHGGAVAPGGCGAGAQAHHQQARGAYGRSVAERAVRRGHRGMCARCLMWRWAKSCSSPTTPSAATPPSWCWPMLWGASI